jgi:hypothetical protein
MAADLPMGSMQQWPLTLDKILDYAAKWHGDQEICCRCACRRTALWAPTCITPSLQRNRHHGQ